jgi:hypothetical protein
MRIFSVILFSFGLIISLSAQVEDTITTESGLKYIINEKGSGEKAVNGKSVEVHYTGYLADGKIFDSSIERGEPIDFVLGTGLVIKGWDEGIALMNVGDKYRLIIPAELGYGSRGAGNAIPPNSDLIFDVELINVTEAKIPIGDVFIEVMFEHGLDSAAAKYRELRENNFDQYNFKESQLNNLGYEFLQVGDPDKAIEIFKLNLETYPESSNVYDSLAEAYMVKGETELAIENYEKSLELNPKNHNAEEMLKKLKQ